MAEMLLSLQNVSKRFPGPSGERMALKNICLELRRGQIMGVFGPSGSGKTTLLRIAAGVLTPDAGEVTYNGERLDRMSSSERNRLRRREISCVWSAQPSQERLSVLDHVMLALLIDGRDRRRAERAAQEALLACEVEHCARAELRELSDGERQRVAIARAIVTEPRLLLADRPACGLSLIEQESVSALLATLAQDAKVAVLVTESDAEALLCTQPVLYLREGTLVQPGNTNTNRHTGHGRIYRFPDRRRVVAGDA